MSIATPKGSFDNKPLWEYLNAAGKAFCGPIANHDEMAACLANMRTSGGDTTYFLESLGNSGRFAWVPLFWKELDQKPLNIREFRPVFLQTTLWGCEPGPCVLHDPGEPLASPILGNHKLDSLTALQIPRANLPDIIDDGYFGKGSQTFYAITE